VATRITHHLQIDGFPLVFDPASRQLALRFTGAEASPLNAFLASVALSPSRLDAAIDTIRVGKTEVRGKFRLVFAPPSAWRGEGWLHDLLLERWRGTHGRPLEAVALRLEHHKRRCRRAWIAPSTLLAVLDHLRNLLAGDRSSVLSASRYTLRRLRIDGIAARIRSEGGARFLEIEGAEVDGADILVHSFSGAYGDAAFYDEMWRTGGSRPDQGFGFGPITYPYRHEDREPRFRAMKAAWERARKRALTEPVWSGGANWESIHHYLPHSTLRKLADLARAIEAAGSLHHGASPRPYVSVKELSIDGFLAKRWDMNGVFHQVKLTQARHNPINWMVRVLNARFIQDLPSQLAALERGDASPGPGTSFARFPPGHAELEHPEFAAMKATWEASTGRRLIEPVWKVHDDWEPAMAFIPQSSLESLVKMASWPAPASPAEPPRVEGA
jgi:hypothetical protein